MKKKDQTIKHLQEDLAAVELQSTKFDKGVKDLKVSVKQKDN